MIIAKFLSNTFDEKQDCLKATEIFEIHFWCLLAAVFIYIACKWWRGPFYQKNNRLDGKVIVITGCNTGIGKETALELAKRGARVYMACRNFDKCENARREIVNLTGNTNVFNRSLDLSSLQSVRDFAEQFHKEEKHLDILINNAGIVSTPYKLTEDGFEQQLGVNHLGHFLLTNLLLDLLKASPSSRIVVVSSYVYVFGHFDKDDINLEKNYGRFAAYTRSKLANILFTHKLSRLLKDSNVTVNCLHPGVVQTEMSRYDRRLYLINLMFGKLFFKSSIAGAQTTLYLALDPELQGKTGGFYSDMKLHRVLPKARDAAMADWLWEESAKMVGLTK